MVRKRWLITMAGYTKKTHSPIGSRNQIILQEILMGACDKTQGWSSVVRSRDLSSDMTPERSPAYLHAHWDNISKCPPGCSRTKVRHYLTSVN